MAADFITVSRSVQHGNSTIRLANMLQEVQNLAEDLEGNAQHQWDTGVHTLLEAKFGLATGTGANFLTLLGSVKTALQASILQEFVERVAGQ